MATATKTTPAKTAATKAEVKGSAWLAEHVNSQCGTEYDAYTTRILLRKLAKDGTIERGEGRYEFSGVKDPIVVAVVKAVKSGAVEKAKQEKLDELKTKREAKKATEPAPAKAAPKARASRAKAKPVEETPADEDELDLDEI